VWIWVHGGGYRTGDKSNQMADKVRLAREQGWILVSVNYRLTDPAEPTSARFPDHFDDVAAAVAWVHETIARYGGDPDRIALFGHSAGADIVSNVATVPTYLRAHGLDLDVLSCAGPLDTEGFDKAGAGAADPDGERDQWQAALGNHPGYLTATSATLQVRPRIGIPPMIGVVRGTARRREIEAAFLDTVRSTGVDAVAIDAGTLTHGQVASRIGRPGDTVMTGPVVAFLQGCFA
jgi:acetyl esterase/lipase